MNEAPIKLGNGLVAKGLPLGKGWRIEKEGDPWNTPKLLRATYASLAEAQEAVRKWNLGLLREKYTLSRNPIPDVLGRN